MANIVLIGMPGCGKSTLGVVLAKILNMKFCDMDLLVQQTGQRRLQEILDQDGVESFLNLEESVYLSARLDHTVIATSGSAVLREKAVMHLKENGILVYLRLSYETIAQRITNFESRGIVKETDETLFDIYQKRTPLYEKYADITIDAEGLSASQSLQILEDRIKNFSKK